MSSPRLILASTSKYRQNLLGRLKIAFTSVSPICDEDIYKALNLPPKETAARLAYEKAKSIFIREEGLGSPIFVIGSDQVVSLDNKWLEKPGTQEKACSSLLACSGKTIVLTTAVCVLGPATDKLFEVSALMTFKILSREEIQRYVEKDLPLDCAGSFKFESHGHELFAEVKCDDLTTIEGLPLKKLSETLRDCGFRQREE